MSVREVLIRWLALRAPMQFTSTVAYEAVALGMGLALEQFEEYKSDVSYELERLSKTGYLKHAHGSKTYDIIERPAVIVGSTATKTLAPVASQPLIVKKTWKDIPRPERLQKFDQFLRAFNRLVEFGEWKAIGGGVFDGDAGRIFQLAPDLILNTKLEPWEIQIELADARTFGLFFYGEDHGRLRWRGSTVLLLARYVKQNECLRLRNKILTFARIARGEAVDDRDL